MRKSLISLFSKCGEVAAGKTLLLYKIITVIVLHGMCMRKKHPCLYSFYNKTGVLKISKLVILIFNVVRQHI